MDSLPSSVALRYISPWYLGTGLPQNSIQEDSVINFLEVDPLNRDGSQVGESKISHFASESS